MKVCIIGIGVFGRSLIESFAQLGAEIMAFDISPENVDSIKDSVSVAAALDPADKNALAQFPIAEVDIVIIAMGDNFETSLFATTHVQELGAKRIFARVLSPVHERILMLMKVERTFIPEQIAAKGLAKSLMLGNVSGLYELDDRHSIIEVPVPAALIGIQPVKTQDLREYGLVLVTVRRKVPSLNPFRDRAPDRMRVVGRPTEELTLEDGDVLVIFGSEKNIREFLGSAFFPKADS